MRAKLGGAAANAAESEAARFTLRAVIGLFPGNRQYSVGRSVGVLTRHAHDARDALNRTDMEIAEVRKRLLVTIDRAKRRAAERQARADEASRAYEHFLDRTAVPIFRQVASALRAERVVFTVFTPGGSVRLMSDRAAEDFIELTLDTSGIDPVVSGHTSRIRGRRVVEAERPLGPPAMLTEEDVLEFVLKEIEPFVER